LKEFENLAPKSSYLLIDENKKRKVQKGAVKSHVSGEWYRAQYADLSLSQSVEVTNKFRVDKKTMTIEERTSSLRLALPEATKRKSVVDEKQKWIDTTPMNCSFSMSESGESVGLLVKTLWEKIHQPPYSVSEVNESQNS
jgi:predicted metal-dependent hydrolase